MKATTIDILQRNHPDVSEVQIRLLDDGPSDEELAQALSQNRYISEVVLCLHYSGTSADWIALLHEIETRENLNAFVLDGFEAQEGKPQHHVALLKFLRAAQRNPSIVSLELKWLQLTGEAIAVLKTATSLRRLKLFYCKEMEDRDTHQLATVLQRSTTIQTLELIVQCQNGNYVLPILQSLPFNVSIKKFVLGFFRREYGTEEISLAIQHLFKSTTTIERVELWGFSQSFHQAEVLQPVVNGLIASKCITDIKLDFPSGSALVSRILQDKQNLRSLSLVNGSFGREPQICKALVTALLHPQSLLRSLTILEYSLVRDVPDLRALLHAVVHSKLDRFSIGVINSQAQFHAITSALPNIRVQHMDLKFGFMARDENEELLLALKQNYCVQTVTGKHQVNELLNGTDLFDKDEEKKKQLALVMQRNTGLVNFADNPETVNGTVWPEALNLACDAGQDALFRSLRSVLGSGYAGSSNSERKRKRPRLHY